jgi:hypothetical protein
MRYLEEQARYELTKKEVKRKPRRPFWWMRAKEREIQIQEMGKYNEATEGRLVYFQVLPGLHYSDLGREGGGTDSPMSKT